MNFINKQYIAFFQIGKHAGQVSGFFQYGAGAVLDHYAYFVGYNMGQRGFTEPGRSRQDYMIESFLPFLRSPNKYRKVFDHFLLAYKLIDTRWSNRLFISCIIIGSI